MAADIKACQARGKAIILSLGGATGAATFSSDSQASSFADTVWNLFLGGSSSTRPFGDAVLDGYVASSLPVSPTDISTIVLTWISRVVPARASLPLLRDSNL